MKFYFDGIIKSKSGTHEAKGGVLETDDPEVIQVMEDLHIASDKVVVELQKKKAEKPEKVK